MVIAGLILIPAVAGLIAMFWRSRIGRRGLLVAVGLVHLGLTVGIWLETPASILGGWLAVDPLGQIFLTIVSVLFLASAVYALGYLKQEERSRHVDVEEGFLFSNEPEATFIGCLLLFLSAMSLVTVCQHFGLLWVGVEATTLASAPLIYFHRHHRSLEATWKYILICSVGIALALLGNFLLAVAAHGIGEGHSDLLVGNLLAHAGSLDVRWLQAAFLFFLVGYGTKMGLAPLHTWLPDAHSEAPSLVSALLSGALLNCAFLGILRIHQLCVAAGQGLFSQELLILFGLMSMGVAAVFIIRQADFKRMLAYSSVEHMGILALGVGLGGAGVFGALLHAFTHSFTKGALFLIAGNILAIYRTKSIRDVRGVLRVLPVTGALWIAGFLSITGSPPFGTFLSEFTILKASLDQGQNVIAVLYLLFLSLIFIGMVTIMLRMAQGEPTSESATPKREPSWEWISPSVLMAAVLALGLNLPAKLNDTLQKGSESLAPSVGLSSALIQEQSSLPPDNLALRSGQPQEMN